VECTIGRGERPANVFGVVDVIPPEPEHFFAAQAEPESQVDGRAPGVVPAAASRIFEPRAASITVKVARSPIGRWTSSGAAGSVLPGRVPRRG
jgi:hypothetical protein